jgi:hypothetical protein
MRRRNQLNALSCLDGALLASVIFAFDVAMLGAGCGHVSGLLMQPRVVGRWP